MLREVLTLVAVLIAALLLPSRGEAQQVVYGKVLETGDTIPYVNLGTVYVLDYRIFKSERERRRWTRLKRDVLKVYPYSKKAGLVFRDMESQLLTLEGNDKAQRKYVNYCEKKLKNSFEEELRDMTFRQGSILIKLLDRETGHTAHHLVKELKGSVAVFFWQNIGRVFGYNLKSRYDPRLEHDIESIIVAIENNRF